MSPVRISAFRLIVVILILMGGPAGAAEARPPNIVFIFADDMGWGDARCYGHPYAQTPNIDRLAAEGTRFLQCYATGVTCCPSRTGFMTGKFPATFQKYPANGGFSGRVTITELLKQHGYATGHFGKWHIGTETKPGTYGLDVVGANDDLGGRRRDPGRGRDARLYDEASRFVEQHKDGPFYVNVWGHVPHYPVNPSQALLHAFGPLTVDESKFAPEMREKFAVCKQRGGDVSQHLRAYLAELKSTDDEIGRLLRRLDELGLRDTTIVVFSSDQGPAPVDTPEEMRAKAQNPRQQEKQKKKNKGVGNADTDEVRLNAMGYAGPFRGSKHKQYEGGVRIPFIVRWPGRVPAGRVDGQSVVSGIDWLPTLCALTGTKLPPADLDGEDASRAWLGGDFARTKPLFWKTSAPQSPGAVREGRWKLHHPNSRRGSTELYDVVADPGEHHNLAAQHPEVVKRLAATLERWQATLPKTYDKAGPDDDQ